MRRAFRRLIRLGIIGAIGYVAWRVSASRRAGEGVGGGVGRSAPTGDEGGGALRLVQGLRAEGNDVDLVDVEGVLVDLEPTEPTEPTWVGPDAEGTCPTGFAVKAKLASGIFHVPGATNYDRTKADRCYPSAEAAELDGLRPPKR